VGGTNSVNMEIMSPSSGSTIPNMTYNHTSGVDNGQIANSVDAVTGETINYQYDRLKRLVNASSTISGNAHWSHAYSYDGFGNLTGMTPGSGGARSLSTTVNPTNDQIQPANIAYDGNGNVTHFGPSGSLTSLGYDVANRVATVNSSNAYRYDSANQRVYFRNSAGTETLYVWYTVGSRGRFCRRGERRIHDQGRGLARLYRPGPPSFPAKPEV